MNYIKELCSDLFGKNISFKNETHAAHWCVFIEGALK